MKSLKELIDARNKAVADARTLLDGAKDGKLSSEEEQQYDRIDNEIDRLQGEIDAKRAQGNRQTPPARLGSAGSQGEIKVNLGRRGEMTLQPGTPEHGRASKEYEESFAHYLSGGQVGRQSLALQVSNKAKGGILVPTMMAAGIIQALDDMVFMRQLATTQTLGSAVSLGAVSYDTDYADADWTPEVRATDMSEDDDARWGSRELMPHLLTKLVLWSQKLARSVPSLLEFVKGRVAYKFGITEEKAFLTGDGAQKPLGVFVASEQGVPTSRDVVAGSATAFVSDDIWRVFFNLKEQYQKAATWLVSREFISRLRRLKTTDNQYIWQPGMNGMPGTICDRPYVTSEHVPATYTTGLYVAMLADFKTGYWIADAIDMTFEDVSLLFTLQNKGGVKASKETDGAPVQAEAFSRLILG